MVLPGATRGATHPMIPSYLDIRSQQMQPNLCSYSLEQARHKVGRSYIVLPKRTRKPFLFRGYRKVQTQTRPGRDRRDGL